MEIEVFDDGAFSVFRTRWGTYASRDKEGNGLCTIWTKMQPSSGHVSI